MVCARGRVQPLLAFCRGHVVHFFLADCSSPDEIGFSKLRELSLPYDLIGLQWVTSRVLAVLDCHERLHVIERVLSRDGGTDGVMCVEDLQTLDLERVALVYNSSHFKSLATGGNVSQALALVGERACYQSICNYSIQIFLLGLKAVHILSLTTWKERIDLLVHREHWQCALELAWTFYQGTARAVYGLAGNTEKRKAMVADCMIELLLQYVADTVKKNEHLKAQPAEKACQEVMTMAVDYLILLGRQDVLFGTVWELVSGNSGARASLLSALGTAVLAGRMRTLPPPAARELLSMLRQRGMLANLEACLLQMDVTALDLQQVLDICWTHGLYDAIFYVNNTGMNDYISPMQDILKMLQNSFVPGQQQLPGIKNYPLNMLAIFLQYTGSCINVLLPLLLQKTKFWLEISYLYISGNSCIHVVKVMR
uniref:Vacuolar protein sorting-associated protein 8 central domain-containing protein n=1 Tax=Eptatretus burgeri TaxID=7764 RepID=A0A8C4QTM4_EPTBU